MGRACTAAQLSSSSCSAPPAAACLLLRRVKLQTQEMVDGQIRENAIVAAATYALENTAVTLTFMLLPRLLKPAMYPLIRRFPPKRLAQLNVARMQLFTAALTLARNAMARLGLPWRDEVHMVPNFGERHECSSQPV